MSDHAWTQEHIAAAVADGLSADESERLHNHVQNCLECAAALREARALDHGLASLFAPARPQPALEDRVVQGLRPAMARQRVLPGWRRKLAAGLAASIGIGAAGAAMDRLLASGGVPLPTFSGMFSGADRSPIVVADAMASATSSDSLGSVQNNQSADAQAENLANRLLSQSARAVDNNVSIADGEDAKRSNEQKLSSPAGPDNPGATGHITTWGTSSYAVNGQLVLGVDQTTKDGGPGGYPSTMAYPGLLQAERPTLGYMNPSDQKPALVAAEALPSGGMKGEQASGRRTELGRAEKDPPSPAKPSAPAPAAPASASTEPAAPRKIVIRSGELQFVVESFDAAVATVNRLVTSTDGAFLATVNSDKLSNGRVKGSIVVRVPPERLDNLVLDLRKEIGKAGELKGQRIGSQDITKQYTDLESRLRAARTMETRLLQIIKEGKGEIKQLLEAEKELGVWRTRIEECEGELRYYGSQVALSTLTINIEEKGIRAAAAIAECERVQTGIEVEDVDKALQSALAAVAEANGRVTKSELKQLAAGQFNATLNCEIGPNAAGPFRDRLNQLGRVARLEIDRVQQSEGGRAERNAKVTRGDTQFLVQFYNLANVAPREVRTQMVAVADVPAGYQNVREAVVKAHGRLLTSRLDEQDRRNVTAQIDFEVPRQDEAALSAALAAAGEIVSRNVSRATDGENLTDAKVLFRTALLSAANLKPRETTTLAIEVPDVDAALTLLKAHVAESGGRTVDSQAARERAGRVTARAVYDVPLSAASALVERIKAAGIARVQQSAQDLQAPDGKLATARVDVTLSNSELIVAKDDGLWPQIRHGLALSTAVLLTSVTWVVFGLCVVLPWAVVGYACYRLFRWLMPRDIPAPPGSPAAT
jgi:Domain of unknown function (DUF4349)